jgi:hypothetical protein
MMKIFGGDKGYFLEMMRESFGDNRGNFGDDKGVLEMMEIFGDDKGEFWR